MELVIFSALIVASFVTNPCHNQAMKYNQSLTSKFSSSQQTSTQHLFAQELLSQDSSPQDSSSRSPETPVRPSVWPELPNANLREFCLWMFRRRKRFHVSGPSMLPLLQPGEDVLVNLQAYEPSHLPQAGDLVIVLHPQKPDLKMVKRIMAMVDAEVAPAVACETHVEKGRQYWVEGDNALASTDSRSFGPVPLDCIVGKVTARFA